MGRTLFCLANFVGNYCVDVIAKVACFGLMIVSFRFLFSETQVGT